MLVRVDGNTFGGKSWGERNPVKTAEDLIMGRRFTLEMYPCSNTPELLGSIPSSGVCQLHRAPCNEAFI